MVLHVAGHNRIPVLEDQAMISCGDSKICGSALTDSERGQRLVTVGFISVGPNDAESGSEGLFHPLQRRFSAPKVVLEEVV